MTTTTTTTHYGVLGVALESTYDEIKAAFHRLARNCHPDKNIGATPASPQHDDSSTIISSNTGTGTGTVSTVSTVSTVDQFRQIQQAWEILRDETRRKQYNHELQQQELRNKAKRGGVVLLQWSDLEEAQEEETGETMHVYDCRCGEELLVVDEDILVEPSAAAETTTATITTAGEDFVSSAGAILIECPGCCFVYQLPPPSTRTL